MTLPLSAPLKTQTVHDVVIVGAGSAGIAAARVCRAQGRSARILERRPRIGGRSHTATIAGRPMDLGAHWMHMAAVNPLIALGRGLGVEITDTPAAFPYYVDGRRQTKAETRRLRAAWEKTERRATDRTTAEADLSVAQCLPDVGDWTDSIAFNHGLYSGRAVEEISAFDYARVDDSENKFPRGGYGAIVERLAQGLEIDLDRSVDAIDWSGETIRLSTADGGIEARVVILAVPVAVLASGAIRFTPELPARQRNAIAAFLPAAYEHVIIRWPDSPFDASANQLTLFKGERLRNISLLARYEGSDLHYVEVGGGLMTGFTGHGAVREAFAASVALGELTRHFGVEATRAIEIVHVTNWWDDPASLGSWSLTPPGKALSREAMQEPVSDRLFFAGEFCSPTQWGTVGGAWHEGERAAAAAIAALPPKG